MINILLKMYNILGSLYLKPILNKEQKKRPFPIINERATEYSFTLKYMQKLCTGKVIDIGPGKSSFPHLLFTCGFDVTAIDKIDGYWSTFFNRHYKIENHDITNYNSDSKFQFATCLSVLEHIPNHRSAIKNIHNLLEKNGYLILTFPYNENTYYEDIYKHPNAGYGKNANFITQIYSRNEINNWLSDTFFRIIDQTYYKTFDGELWTIGNRVIPCEEVSNKNLHHLTCILLQKKGD